jgi:two-component system, OmpR family, response regulator
MAGRGDLRFAGVGSLAAAGGSEKSGGQQLSRPRTVLVVDDDPRVRSILRHALESEGSSVLEAATEHEALALFRMAVVDLVTLDLKLGHADGLQLAREMRAISNVPLIMITGKHSEIARIVGLEHGADDYIVKPFNMRETMLRIRNVLRRYEAPLVQPERCAGALARRVCAFDGCVLDLSKRELRSSDGDVIDLTDAEFRLLTVFVENPGRVLSRDELARTVQGRHWSPLDRTVDGHVARLRRKLEAAADEPRIIKSVRTVGYVFTVAVSSR